MAVKTVIESLRMENFGCFRDRTIEFGPGINQIIGLNESGKSTILKALFIAIFEDGATRKKRVAEHRSWNREQGFRLILNFSVGEKHFTLTRDYDSGHDRMVDSDDNVYEGKVIGERLAEYFSTSDRNLFESVFHFSSDHPDALENNKDRLLSALELPVFFGFDRGRADRYLDEKIKSLDNPRAHGPRELDILADQLANRIKEKSELDDRLNNLKTEKQELESTRAKLNESKTEVALLEKEISGAESYQQLSEKMANLEVRLHIHLANYSRASQIFEDLEKIESELSGIVIPDEDEFTFMTRRRDSLAGAVNESKQVMDSLIERRSWANRGFLAGTLLLALLCLLHVFQIKGFLDVGEIAGFVPYAIPIMTIVWLLQMSSYISQFRGKRKATESFRQKVHELDAFYAELNTRFGMTDADPIKALEETAIRRQALELSVGNLEETINSLSENKGLEHLVQIKEGIESEVVQLNNDMALLTSHASAAGRLPEIKKHLRTVRNKTDALRERTALLTERCSAHDPLVRNIATVDTEIEILKRKHNDLCEQLEILRVTRLALNHAADRLIEDTFSQYSRAASQYLSLLTGGKYTRLQLSKSSGSFEIYIAESKKWLEISDLLSSSTRDAVYLALRLAGISRLSSDFIPPVIFDQAELRMDQERRSHFFESLLQAAEDRQVVYIALSRAEQLTGSHIVEMMKSPETEKSGIEI